MRNAAPSIERFFINIICCVCRIIGSVIVQKLCIINVTGIKKAAIIQAPHFALKPSMMLILPINAIIPERGTKTLANGTPLPAADSMVEEEKFSKPESKKINE